MFVKHEVEKSTLDMAKMEERFVKLAETVEERKIKIEDGILTNRTDLARFPSPTTDTSGDRKINPKTYSNFTSSE